MFDNHKFTTGKGSNSRLILPRVFCVMHCRISKGRKDYIFVRKYVSTIFCPPYGKSCMQSRQCVRHCKTTWSHDVGEVTTRRRTEQRSERPRYD